MSFRFLRSNH